jgi:hypothetical protein
VNAPVAEEFIVGWARELPMDSQLGSLCICLRHMHPNSWLMNSVEPSLGIFIELELNELFRIGRRAMAIGLTVVSFSVILGQAAAASLTPPVGSVVQESSTIFGWVANWRPIEIFLYEWWPIVRRRKLYQRLSAAEVDLRPYKNGQPQALSRT